MRLHNSILFITFVILTLAGFGYPALGQEAIGANTAGETPGVSAPVSPSPAGENTEMVAQPARSAGVSQPAVPAPSQVAYATEWIAETKKSIAVMERVIDHVLSTALGGDYEISGFFSKGCNGYWIPGTGLCFQMKVRFPLQVPPPPDEPAQPPVGDLWEKFAQELGENQPPAPAYPVPFGPQGNVMEAANSHKVDLLKKQLYAVLADY
ncbi:MAG: hypothetical protein RBU29_09290, partial [bacterium]|nr:hypothetical protein [bacterium]